MTAIYMLLTGTGFLERPGSIATFMALVTAIAVGITVALLTYMALLPFVG
jgi:hypothetical protein